MKLLVNMPHMSVDCSETDAEFRRWLAKRLSAYDRGLLIDWRRYVDAGKWKSAASGQPADAGAQAGYAAALFVARDYPSAKAAAEKALALDGKNALALYLLGEIALDAHDSKAARARFEALRANGVDGYGIELALGEIAAADDDKDSAIRHYDAAKPFDPDRAEPYQLLAAIYRGMHRDADAIKEMRGYTLIEEHEADAARRLFDAEVAAKDTAGILDSAPRVTAIQPMQYYVHEQYGVALAASNRERDAVREFTAALGCAPRKPAPIHVELARAYQALGDKPRARAAAEAALKEDPGNTDAAALLKALGE